MQVPLELPIESYQDLPVHFQVLHGFACEPDAFVGCQSLLIVLVLTSGA